jgi:glyoxylase-like metal-dependent hydrolase (beta-lactamase superfamily II)
VSTFDPIEITPNFYQLGTPPFPVYLSLGKDAMLIEGGTGGTFGIIVAQIEALGVDPARIKYLALTHTHADHIGALPRLKALWPHLQAVASEKAPKIFADEKALRHFISMDTGIADIMVALGEIPEAPAPLDEYVFPVDRTVTEGDRIDLGEGICWTAYAVPGHSACHLAWREEKEEVFAIGDALGFYAPREDVFWPNYFVSLTQYCDSIRKLGTLPARLLALGHNGVKGGETRGFLRKALAATEAYHREMTGRIAKGEDPAAIAREKGDWVCSIAEHMPNKAMGPICGVLIKRSRAAAAENPDLSFKL